MTKSIFMLFLVLIACYAKAQTEIRADSAIIKSKLKIINHNEGLGKVLTSDALGNASWQTVSGLVNFWQLGGSTTEIIPNSPVTKVKIPGSLQITTGAGTGKYLRSTDASGNAAWATFPSFSLSLPYSGFANLTSPAFSIENNEPTGQAFRTRGNIQLQNIFEFPGKILFSTDDQGDAKWENGNCISKCTFSITRGNKANIPNGSVQLIPFNIENFDICDATTFVDLSGDNDFHYFKAPFEGIYQFEFNGSFLTTTNFALMIHKLNSSNLPVTQVFASTCQGNSTETSQRYTAVVKLLAGDKVAPTIQGFSSTSSIAFNNSNNSLLNTFTGHIIETTDCTALKTKSK